MILLATKIDVFGEGWGWYWKPGKDGEPSQLVKRRIA